MAFGSFFLMMLLNIKTYTNIFPFNLIYNISGFHHGLNCLQVFFSLIRGIKKTLAICNVKDFL